LAAGLSYQARKDHQADTLVCLRSGCEDPAADGSAYCAPHRDKELEYKRKWRAKQVRRRARRKQCRDCGAPLRSATATLPAEKIWCTAHRIERNRLNALRVAMAGGGDTGVEKTERIAAATRKDDDGRIRYRGQMKRGQQPRPQLNRQDLGMAKECFQAFAAGIELLATDDARSWPSGDRESVEKATANRGARAQRHVGDILERLGHFQQRHGPRPGDAPTGLPDPDDDGTLSYKRVGDAVRIAAAARAGLYVYAPPLDVVSGRRETAKEPKPPDLAPLHAALAARGLGLVAEGAFYWIVIETRQGRRDGDE
jgi:hypothetical protein